MKLKIFLWLVVLAWLWGPAFLLMKVAVEEIPPLTMVLVRVGTASLILYLILKVQGRTLPKIGLIWLHFAVVGLLNNALPFSLLSWGEQYVDSAVAAILIGTTPIFTMVIAHLFTDNDHFTPSKSVGIVIGFVGLVILVSPTLLSGVEATLWGLVACIGAAASYAAAIVYTRQTLRGLPPLVGPTAQLIMATIFLLPLSLTVDQPYSLPLPSWVALGSVLLLAVFSTALAYVLYYRVMEFTSATNLSLVTYMIPIVGAILGVTVLGEQIGWHDYLGFLLILSGVIVANGVFRSISWRQLAGAAIRRRATYSTR